jgi:periplasmic copper chaperone A
MFRWSFCLLAFLAVAFGGALTAEAGSISVDKAWSRATPKGAKVAAGYMTIKNDGDQPDRLVSVSADFAGKTQIHQMSMADGMMKMRPVPEGIVIPPKSSVVLEPAGYHLMFMDFAQLLKEGDSFPAKLNFEHAGSMAVTFQVLGMGAQAPE